MPRVICELPNASLEISGVSFTRLDDGRILSEEVEQAIADFFLSIPGYVIDGADADDDGEGEKTGSGSQPAAQSSKQPTAREKKAAAKAAAAPAAVVAPQAAPAADPVATATPAPVDAADESGAASAVEGESTTTNVEGGAAADAPADDVF